VEKFCLGDIITELSADRRREISAMVAAKKRNAKKKWLAKSDLISRKSHRSNIINVA
jgi:hypothetical protein